MSSGSNRNLAGFFKEMRLYRGFSQGKLAEDAGINPSYISRIESGERIPHREILDRVCGILGLREGDSRYHKMMNLAGYSSGAIPERGSCTEIETLKDVYDKSTPENQAEIRLAVRILNEGMVKRLHEEPKSEMSGWTHKPLSEPARIVLQRRRVMEQH